MICITRAFICFNTRHNRLLSKLAASQRNYLTVQHLHSKAIAANKSQSCGPSFENADENVIVNTNETQPISFKNLAIQDANAFSNVMKYVKRFEKYTSIKDLEKSTDAARKLRDEFIQKGNNENFKQTMINNLNSLLFFFYSSKNLKELDETFNLMDSNSMTNESTYAIMIKHKTEEENWRIGLQLIEEMKSKGIKPHLRTYSCLISDAVKTGDLTEALSLFKKLQDLELVFNDEFYSSLIDASIKHQESSNAFLLEIFSMLQGTGSTFGQKAINKAKSWFSRLTHESKNVFNVKISSVDERGLCCNCGAQLKDFELSETAKHNLENSLFQIAQDAVMNRMDRKTGSSLEQLLQVSNIKSSSPSSKIDALRHLVNTSGPYDVIIDVLNIAYNGNKGFNSFQVKRVIKHFLQQGQRVLAICSSPLLSSLLVSENAAFSNQHMVNLLHYMKRNKCGIFFVDDRKEEGHIDDYFVLLSVVYHKMNANIVTCDNFFDLIHSTDQLNKHHFKRWRRSHQIVLKYFTRNGQPVFAARKMFDIDVQSKDGNWHLPGNDEKWLCCTKRISDF